MTDVTQEDRDAARRAARGDQLVPGNFRFITDGARVTEKANKNGFKQAVASAYPLRDPDDAGSADFRVKETLWIALPLENPEIEGHKVDAKTLKDAAGYFNALFPERIPFVRKKKEDGTYKTDKEYQEELEGVYLQTRVLAREIVANPSMLDDLFFYGSTTLKTNGNGNWLNNVFPVLTGDRKLTPASEFIA